MINYRMYSVEELAADDMFRRWVLAPTPEITSFWQQWLNENPERADAVARARELVNAVHNLYGDDLTDNQVEFEVEEIVRLAEARKEPASDRIIYWPALWKSAAAVVLVSGLALLYYTHKSPVEIAEKAPFEQIKEEVMQVRVNNSAVEMTILLGDNSVATLSKGSTIRYPKKFDAKERRVYLTGEAFFDVAKNPAQPFLVYTNETVTKVLGTSFRVKAFDDDNTVLVVVKTGRVSVYPKKAYETAAGETPKMAGVVLNPNQQAVFIRKENRLEKGMVSQPQLLSESISQKDQVFDDKPVTEVLQALQKTYGIVIIYNAETLANCAISAQFDDETLKQRMNAICEAIGASYEMINGQIMLVSKGCN
ncbi:FecR family protein [Dyadobacter luticola]|uniref:DUF4974 domain-containing protein n=1 Tax=Dyadobacter luticola TaxID=1979387 RepID=A0A5R9L423_9BACT|nr:FecR domain-containing protein [Dyadobacter luticola]TLV03020.1 DUF4974 domain-containing protein [Dyadobacter luticola]